MQWGPDYSVPGVPYPSVSPANHVDQDRSQLLLDARNGCPQLLGSQTRS